MGASRISSLVRKQRKRIFSLVRKPGSWRRNHPLLTAILLVAASAGIGLRAATAASGMQSEVLFTASITLLFGALLGGVVKASYWRTCNGSASDGQCRRFFAAVLDDLKSVYDRVERVKVLIAAHESALTYGNKMRDLIDSAVQLRNVQRALDQGTSGMLEHREDLNLAVESMEWYLNSLIDEFKEQYKPIADKQRIYDRVAKLLEQPQPGLEAPPNPAWNDIKTLPKLFEFRQPGLRDADFSAKYDRDFTDALDAGCWILRSEFRRLPGGAEQEMPKKHANALGRIRTRPPPVGHFRSRRSAAVDGLIRPGDPAVVFVPGAGGFGLDFLLVHQRVAESATSIIYDRAGTGWSDDVELPRSADEVADELRAVLQSSGATAPYLLVGHSLGGLYVQRYVQRFPDEVAGLLLLLAPAHEDGDTYMPERPKMANQPTASDMPDLPQTFLAQYRSAFAELFAAFPRPVRDLLIDKHVSPERLPNGFREGATALALFGELSEGALRPDLPLIILSGPESTLPRPCSPPKPNCANRSRAASTSMTPSQPQRPKANTASSSTPHPHHPPRQTRRRSPSSPRPHRAHSRDPA